jgi:hypothetical protein
MLIQKIEQQEASPDRARALAAVPILEQVGTEECRQLLEKIAAGAAGVRLTVEAKAAVERLNDAAKKGRTSQAPPEGRDGEALWDDLASDDAARAYQAIGYLTMLPQQSLPLLHDHLKPVGMLEGKHLDQLLSDLENDDFAQRQRAADELARLGALAAPALKKALTTQTALDTRKRIEQILERLTPGQTPAADTLRELRAIEALGRLGSKDSRALLEALAKGAPEAPLTLDARAALERLSHRSAVSP